MKNALVLHGADSDPQNNWFPWLKEKLEKQNYKVWTPALPNSETPVLKDWLDTIFSNLDWEFNESIIIGHSAGATLIPRILEKLPLGIIINQAIMVAPFATRGSKPEYFHYKDGLLATPFNWSKIKNSCKQFYFIASNNDQYQCGSDQAKIFQEYLGGELIIKPDEGHFNLEQNLTYKKFPLLLKLIE